MRFDRACVAGVWAMAFYLLALRVWPDEMLASRFTRDVLCFVLPGGTEMRDFGPAAVIILLPAAVFGLLIGLVALFVEWLHTRPTHRE